MCLKLLMAHITDHLALKYQQEILDNYLHDLLQPILMIYQFLNNLNLIHMVLIPITGTSVNPARSLGPAIFAGGMALSQLWLFIVAPIAGAIFAALVRNVFVDD